MFSGTLSQVRYSDAEEGMMDLKEVLRQMESSFGGRWYRLEFSYGGMPKGGTHLEGVRFCEAVTRASLVPVVLTAESLSCDAARYAFGWNHDVRGAMEARLEEQAGFPHRYAVEAIGDLPTLDGGLRAIGINTEGEPQVFMAYLQPQQVMKLLRRYEALFCERPRVELSSIAALCSNVAVRALRDGKLTLSFGCEESRRHGGIPRDRVIVGLPVEVAKRLLEGS